MGVMRYTIVDKSGTTSFVAPWNTLKALVAACSRKPAPDSLLELLEAASKYSSGLSDYVLNGLAVFDEHNSQLKEDNTEPGPALEIELDKLLAEFNLPDKTEYQHAAYDKEVSHLEISYEDLLIHQKQLQGAPAVRYPVLRVIDLATRQESLEPIRIGLVIFNLLAKRIVQVQNSYGVLRRSDRGRYFEDGQPTERLYFYRLPVDWNLLP